VTMAELKAGKKEKQEKPEAAEEEEAAATQGPKKKQRKTPPQEQDNEAGAGPSLVAGAPPVDLGGLWLCTAVEGKPARDSSSVPYIPHDVLSLDSTPPYR
jgi:hypothetical protein